MSGGTLARGIAFAVLCVITGILIGWPIGHARGLKHAAEDAEDAATAAVVAGWKGLPDEDAPSPPWPDAEPGICSIHGVPRPCGICDGTSAAAPPGKHRHPAGPRHAALPSAGYLPAPGPWDGTITVPAPAQAPPWAAAGYRDAIQDHPGWEQALEDWEQVLEPTAVLPPPDPRTDTAWTREMVREMDAWIAEHITATDSTLKEITR